MTVIETKNRIEAELAELAAGFGNAADRVKYEVQISENEIDGAPTDITYIFGSLIIGKADAPEEDKLYLPLDAELDDEDNVDEERFNKNLEVFKARVAPIRERLVNAEDVDAEITAIIADFDSEMERKYQEEIDRLNRVAKRNLITAGLAAVGLAVIAAIILLIDRFA